jgi:hypothetical protein
MSRLVVEIATSLALLAMTWLPGGPGNEGYLVLLAMTPRL